MEQINSKSNTRIKEVKKLLERKNRNKEKKFLVEGFRFLDEALKSKYKLQYIMVDEALAQKWEEFKLKFNDKINCDVLLVESKLFRELCETQTPQGVLGVVEYLEEKLEVKDGVYILLDKIQDPGNMGTIIRSVHACGFNGIITTKGTVDIYNGKTLRSTMGSVFRVPVIEDCDSNMIDELKNKGFKFIVSTLEDSVDFYDSNLKDNIVIVIGNEGNGVSQEVMDIADIKVRIPMPGGSESLNAGVAASVMMYEVLRQRR